jgi:hypothetical protein
VWEAAKNVETWGPMRNRVRSIAQRLTKRQESNERWKANRLAEWEKLRRPKSYGRMWREIEPQGPGGIKPLRE